MILKFEDIVKDQLVLHLDTTKTDCYPRTGQMMYNLITPSDVGYLSGGTVFNTTNGSMDFNGTDAYIDFPLPNSFTQGSMTGFSISVWVINSGDTGGITTLWAGPTSDNGIELEMYFGDVYVAFTSSDYGYFTYGIMNQWVNLTFTYDGSGLTDSDKLKFYTNGISTPLIYGGVIPSSIDMTNMLSFLLGVIRPFSIPARYLQCEIGHVLGYSKSLTATEVLQNYNATKAWFV